MWQPTSQMNSSPGEQWTRTPIWFDIEPDGTNSGRLLAEQAGDLFLQGVDAGVFVENVVAHWRRSHGRAAWPPSVG